VAGTSVQGENAPEEIVSVLKAINEQEEPDVILLARGGGSIEDLWAFNDERVVRAIANSEAPVITGIGHETDFTLADFAADLRAPTPTAAAELATPEIGQIRADFVNLAERLQYLLTSQINNLKMQLAALQPRLMHASPQSMINNDRQNLDGMAERLAKAVGHILLLNRTQLCSTISRLESLNPIAILKRGYAIVMKPDGSIIRQASQVQAGDPAKVRLSKGGLEVQVTRKLENEGS